MEPHINSEFKLPKRNFWQIIFYSANEARLRAGWRILLHTLFIVIISILTGIIVFYPIGLLKISFESPIVILANEVVMLIGITGATFLARRFLDKRSIVSLGLTTGPKFLIDIFIGIIIAFFQLGLVFIIEIGMGWTIFSGFAWQTEPISAVLSGLGLWLGVFIIVGWQEELLSRGYHLQSMESGLNLFWAVIISSSIFGSLHIFNPGATWVSTIGIILAGLFLALPYLITRQLWISIGLHIGWNFSEGVVFGFPVSGTESFRLLRHSVGGPVLWTGGDFGPEAGLLIIPGLLLGTLLILAYTKSIPFQKTLKK